MLKIDSILDYRSIAGSWCFQKTIYFRLPVNDVDAVLPYPMPYEHNIHAHHKRYLKEVDWNALLTVLRELRSEYSDYFQQVLEHQYLYNYNVILAKNCT